MGVVQLDNSQIFKNAQKKGITFFLHQNIKFLAIEIFDGCKVTSSRILKKEF